MYAKRNTLLMQSLMLHHLQSETTMQISARQISGHAGNYSQLYGGPPYALSERAWVLQDRLLAPRKI